MIAALALVVGVVLGLVFEPTVPLWLQPYLPIAVVAALDAVFGGIRARLDGIFDAKVFVVSFVSNVLVAALIVFLGDKLGVGAQLSTGGGGRARDPDLRQRGGDPPAPLPGMSTDEESQPRREDQTSPSPETTTSTPSESAGAVEPAVGTADGTGDGTAAEPAQGRALEDEWEDEQEWEDEGEWEGGDVRRRGSAAAGRRARRRAVRRRERGRFEQRRRGRRRA